MHTWHGNSLVLARALAYILVNGGDGLRRIAETAVLNANWIRQRLTGTYDVPFDRPCMHEVVLSVRSLKQAHGVRALDVAKRLLEEGFHSPTVYFPLIVDEALMIEPTETESPQTLEALADSLERIADEAARDNEGWMAEFPRPRRSGGWMRPGPPAPSSPPSTPGPDGGVTGGGRHLHHPLRRSVPTVPQVRLRPVRRPGGQAQQPGAGPAAHHHRPEEPGCHGANGLTYCRDRGDFIVVASNGGSDRPPAWLLNLQADPQVTVRVGRQVFRGHRTGGRPRGTGAALAAGQPDQPGDGPSLPSGGHRPVRRLPAPHHRRDPGGDPDPRRTGRRPRSPATG